MSKPRTGIPADDSTAPPFSSARKGAPSASDYSQPHSGGLKTVANEEAWGEQKATDRYGGTTKTFRPENLNANKPQKAGDPNNLQGNYYDNDVRNSWLRGGPDESAEGKPNFDPRGKDGLPKKW